MKHLKTRIMLLLTVAIFTSCEKEQIIVTENSETSNLENKQLTYQRSLDTELNFFVGEELEDFPCMNLPTEDFSEGNYYSFLGPLDMNTDNDAFSPGDILPGISFETNANDYSSPLVLWQDSYWGADMVLYTYDNYDYYDESELIINFEANNVTSARMKIAQVWTSGFTNIYIEIYGESANLLGTTEVYIQPYGINWGVTSLEPIKKIILRGQFPGVDNVSFGNCEDMDGDGVLNEDDPYPNSNMSETINIGGNYLNIDNVFSGNGTTMMDQIDALVSEMNAQYTGDNYAYLHKRFMTKLSAITYYWIKDRLITATQRSQISSAAWSADIPYFNQQN